MAPIPHRSHHSSDCGNRRLALEWRHTYTGFQLDRAHAGAHSWLALHCPGGLPYYHAAGEAREIKRVSSLYLDAGHDLQRKPYLWSFAGDTWLADNVGKQHPTPFDSNRGIVKDT